MLFSPLHDLYTYCLIFDILNMLALNRVTGYCIVTFYILHSIFYTLCQVLRYVFKLILNFLLNRKDTILSRVLISLESKTTATVKNVK